MPTVDEFRAALNDVAASTAPLASDHVLGAGRRLRRRRRVLAGGGTALAVAGVVTGAVLLAAPATPPPAPVARPPVARQPVPAASTPFPAQLDASSIDDLVLPDNLDSVVLSVSRNGRREEAVIVRRDPGRPALPPATGDIVPRKVAGVWVRVTPRAGDRVGYEWVSPLDVRWALVSDGPLSGEFLEAVVRKANTRR